jgi:Cdc6-like AAA superfamily ATPase
MKDSRYIYKDLGIFIYEHFVKYMQEMARNAKFEPFNLNLDGEFNGIINGKPIVDTRSAVSRAFGGAYALNDDGYFTEKMTQIEAEMRKSNIPDEERFLKMCHKACELAYEEWIKVAPVANY